VESGQWVEPLEQRLDAYLEEWIAGQLKPSTLSSYRKNIRLHVTPYLVATPVAKLTGSAVDRWMRVLEASGRPNGSGGRSPRTVRYLFTILRSVLGDAVKQGRLADNPHRPVTPPSVSEARPPEMQAWTAAELRRFLDWAEVRDGPALARRRPRRRPAAGPPQRRPGQGPRRR